jgi:eukaryotic translation initiation factor 2C
MRSMVEERLIAWRDARKTLPTAILMYRDGVSESQLNDITGYECDQIRAAYGDLAGEDAKKKLKITFIVVNKRHNTRFYPSTATQTYTEQGKNGRFLNGNLKPGLLVDDVVTNTGDPNFFLQSHRAIKGTARSAHYHVTLDEMDLKDRIPSLTLKLCYAFGRSTTAVSYAAPAYMADRLCERGRAYLRHWMEDSNMEPIFNMPPYKVGGVQKRAPKSYVNQQKQKFATAIAQHPKIDGKPKLWGQYDESPPNGAKPRLNPWHPYFDDKMFWM